MNYMQIGRVGIVGAKAASIAMAMGLADADIPVTLFDSERASLDKALALARSGYGQAVATGQLGTAARDRRMALLAATVNFHHLKDCDLIIDASGADRAGTEALFRRLDQAARLGAVLATCTQDVHPDAVAGCTRRSGEVIGLHVRQSAPTLWEVRPAKQTSAATLDAVNALVRKLKETGSPAHEGRTVAALAA